MCCVCGSNKVFDINEHHLVPKQYMKHMDKSIFKNYLITVPICTEHHTIYEGMYASLFNKKIAKQYNVPMIHTRRINVFAKEVVSQIKDQKDFAYAWRRNFIENMRPMFIPANASVNTFKLYTPKQIAINLFTDHIKNNNTIRKTVDYIIKYIGISPVYGFTDLTYTGNNITLYYNDEIFQMNDILREIKIQKILK
jgi:hypothetical protein